MSNEELRQLDDVNGRHGVYARSLSLHTFGYHDEVRIDRGWAISDGNALNGRGATYTGRTWEAAYRSWCKGRAKEMN